jgi:AraC-like DNA-binding protein
MEHQLSAGERLAPSGPVRLRAPRPELAAAVSTLWLTEVHAPAALTRIMPDAAVDLVWNGGRLVVAGPDTGPVRERLPAGRVLGVQLRPGAVPAILGAPATELLNGRVELAELWGRPGREVADRMGSAPSMARAIAALEAALLLRLARADVQPDAVPARVRALVARREQPAVRALAADLGLGERQLRRRSVAAFGYGPRTLGRILRFQRVVDALRGPATASLADLAAREGYTDQAHLAREVGGFAGLTPGALRAALRMQ